MIYQNRNVIASKRNIHGVNVFIPERMKLAGQRYVVPFKMSGVRLRPVEPTIFSMGYTMEITMQFSAFTISISDPFTMKTLQSALDYMQSSIRGKGSVRSISKSEYSAIIKG